MKTILTFSLILISSLLFSQMSRLEKIDINDKELFNSLNENTEIHDETPKS